VHTCPERSRRGPKPVSSAVERGQTLAKVVPQACPKLVEWDGVVISYMPASSVVERKQTTSISRGGSRTVPYSVRGGQNSSCPTPLGEHRPTPNPLGGPIKAGRAVALLWNIPIARLTKSGNCIYESTDCHALYAEPKTG